MIVALLKTSLPLILLVSGAYAEAHRGTEADSGAEPTASATETVASTDSTGSVRGSVAGYIAAGYEPASINLNARQEATEKVSDEVVMADGDVIRGRITSENEHEVVIEHPVFKELRIPRNRIVAIKRQAPRPQRPGFGELVTGAGVRPLTSTRRAVVPPTPRSTTVATEAKPAEDATEETATEEAPEDDFEKLVDVDNWSFTMGAAFGYVQNVNNEVNVRLSAQAEHNSDLARLRINSVYFLNRANSELIDNDVEVSTIQDWFFSGSRLSIFAQGTYQWDDFELWEQRLSGYLGPGYKLVNTPDLKIDGRLGAGVTYEYGIPQLLPELLVSTEWNWQIDDRQRISGNFSYAPDVTESQQFRLSLNAEWNFRLQKEEGMSFYVGLRNEYQSIVPEGSTRNDLRLFGGIKYEF